MQLMPPLNVEFRLDSLQRSRLLPRLLGSLVTHRIPNAGSPLTLIMLRLKPALAMRSLRRPFSRNIESYSLSPSNQQRQQTDLRIHQLAQDAQRPIQLHRLITPIKSDDRVPALLTNAQQVIKDITVRLARRLAAMRSLPYMVMLNPYVAHIYNIYYNSFRVLSSLEPPKNEQENEQFVQLLEKLVESHLNTIPTLAKGFTECGRYLDSDTINEILGKHLAARIGTRLLAENHICLSHPVGPNWVGNIQTDVSPKAIIESCALVVGELCNLEYGIVPEIVVEEPRPVTLAYCPNHLEYVCTELLKNAFRAVAEAGNTHVPIYVTIIPTGQGVIIRFRDRGGGMTQELQDKIFRFSFTTFEKEDQSNGLEVTGGSIAGLGYGLPLSRAYAEFFGGRLQVQSYYGWGTDVYLTLKSPMISGYAREV